MTSEKQMIPRFSVKKTMNNVLPFCIPVLAAASLSSSSLAVLPAVFPVGQQLPAPPPLWGHACLCQLPSEKLTASEEQLAVYDSGITDCSASEQISVVPKETGEITGGPREREGKSLKGNGETKRTAATEETHIKPNTV